MMMCKNCENSVAKIVKRYKGHEYRLCEKCMTKFITHEDRDTIVIDHEYKHRKHALFKESK